MTDENVLHIDTLQTKILIDMSIISIFTVYALWVRQFGVFVGLILVARGLSLANNSYHNCLFVCTSRQPIVALHFEKSV